MRNNIFKLIFLVGFVVAFSVSGLSSSGVTYCVADGDSCYDAFHVCTEGGKTCQWFGLPEASPCICAAIQ